MNESSISGICRLTSGETSFLRKSWLNAGLGIGLVCGAVAAAVAWLLFVVSGVDLGCAFRYGEMAAEAGEQEKGSDCEGLVVGIERKALLDCLRVCMATVKVEHLYKGVTGGAEGGRWAEAEL